MTIPVLQFGDVYFPLVSKRQPFESPDTPKTFDILIIQLDTVIARIYNGVEELACQHRCSLLSQITAHLAPQTCSPGTFRPGLRRARPGMPHSI